nr:hypothetical protein [Phytohabitans houttuyneae]
MLARVVRRAVGHAAQPGDRGDVDDRARAGAQHQPPELAAQQERPGQVDVEHPAPVVERGLLQRRDERDTRVVDHHVDAPEALVHRRRERDHVGLRAHVPQHREVRGDRLLVHHRQRVPLGTQHLGHPATDALCGTRHDRHPLTRHGTQLSYGWLVKREE